MDIKAMSDGELAKLMIEVGDEMERRRGGRNLQARLTTVIAEASAANIPVEVVDSAVESAKARAEEGVRRRTPEPETPIVAEKTPAATPVAAVAKVK